MKYLAAPYFSKKLATVAQQRRDELAQALAKIAALSPEHLTKSNLPDAIDNLGSDIYSIRAGGLRVAAALTKRDKEKILLLLDVIQLDSQPSAAPIFINRDPRSNKIYNPLLNSKI